METLKSQSILPRIDGIQRDLQRLASLANLLADEFSLEDNFVKAQFYLRRALEGVFHIGSHILSRIPGGRATEYKEIAVKLGEFNILEKSFAEDNLKKMAGYRNRLTHYYSNITPNEIQKILKEHLTDFDTFLLSVKNLLQHPEKFNLKLE